MASSIWASDGYLAIAHLLVFSENFEHKLLPCAATSVGVQLLPVSLLLFLSSHHIYKIKIIVSCSFPLNLRIVFITPLAEPAASCSHLIPSRFSSHQAGLTSLHLKNRCAPSSSSLLQKLHRLSIFTPLCCRTLLTARVLWLILHKKCSTFGGHSRLHIFFQKSDPLLLPHSKTLVGTHTQWGTRSTFHHPPSSTRPHASEAIQYRTWLWCRGIAPLLSCRHQRPISTNSPTSFLMTCPVNKFIIPRGIPDALSHIGTKSELMSSAYSPRQTPPQRLDSSQRPMIHPQSPYASPPPDAWWKVNKKWFEPRSLQLIPQSGHQTLPSACPSTYAWTGQSARTLPMTCIFVDCDWMQKHSPLGSLSCSSWVYNISPKRYNNAKERNVLIDERRIKQD